MNPDRLRPGRPFQRTPPSEFGSSSNISIFTPPTPVMVCHRRQVSPNRGWRPRANFGTFLDSGMEFKSIVELFGRVAVARQLVTAAWTDELNQRRFELIDKEITG